ncbi:MAG TPA: DNA replication and repair protein RecF [Flavitalea sp.]|nr:DNA replication and repair protein RecF [Flavitalea sp.]
MLALESILLYQFKNYRQARFDFNSRITGISGLNGIGKTNLLDAIYYLCFTKSYFTRTDSQNVLNGANGFRIEGQFRLEQELLRTVCILRETGKKEFLVDEQPYDRFSSHIGRFPCVVIAPDDVHIITEASEERRRFLDALLSQADPIYLQNLIDYTRLLQQRNSYLRSIENRQADHRLLDTYDMQMASTGTQLFDSRRNFLVQFIPMVIELYNGIAGSEEGLTITYKSQLLQHDLRSLLQQSREKDILLQRTNSGVHRDDLELFLNDQPFKSMASQGQRKSLLFALKLAEFEGLRAIKGFAPLLLLDDVFEKLDEQRMHNLLARVCIDSGAQLFVTDTHPERIRNHLEKLDVHYGMISL